MSPRVKAATLACWLLLAGLLGGAGEGLGQEKPRVSGERFAELHRREIEPQIRFQQSAEMGWVMRGISALGPGDFLWGLILFCFCCLDARKAARFAVFLLIGLWLRDVLAMGIGSPRPWWIDERIRTFGDPAARPRSFGFPSGHAMIGTAFWLFLAAEVRRPGAWAVASVVAVSICVSRVYLGVHFISDVVAGLVVGAVYTWIYRLSEPGISSGWERASASKKALATILFAVAMICLGELVRMVGETRPMPQAWQLIAQPARKLEVTASYAGAVLGLGLAVAFVKTWPRSGGPWAIRIQRLALAVVVLGAAELITRYLLKQLPREWEWTRVWFVFLTRGGQAWLAWGWLPRVFDRPCFRWEEITPRSEAEK
jgi:membrane-associated phospholipid phosphatase